GPRRWWCSWWPASSCEGARGNDLLGEERPRGAGPRVPPHLLCPPAPEREGAGPSWPAAVWKDLPRADPNPAMRTSYGGPEPAGPGWAPTARAPGSWRSR